MTPSQILFALIGYFLILITISWITSKNNDETSFYTGNRKSPWFLVAFGMIGASLSGVTFLSVPGWVANSHFGYLQTVLGYMVGYLIIAQILIPLYYRQNLTSIYTYLENRFGENSYKTGAAYFILSRIIGASFRLFLVAGVLHTFVFDPFGIPFWGAVAITIILIFLYTSKSGIKTVVYTDTLQTTFLIAAVILTLIFMINDLNWSLGDTISNLVNDPNTQIFHWDGNSSNVFWKQFLGGVFIALAMTGLDQDMMQKNLSINSIRNAQKNIYIQMALFIVINVIFLSLGALLYNYVDVKGLDFVGKSDELFSFVAMQHATPIVSVAFIIGLVAAAYSSADSALTALTTSFCVDFLGYERSKPTDIKKRRWVHIGFAFILFITILIFNAINNEAVIKELFRAAGFTYGPLLGLFSFGILTKNKINDKYVVVITLISILLTGIYFYGMPMLVEGFEAGFELIIINGFFTYILLHFNSYLHRKKS
ncbi:MAG: sodium:solute symporter [Bacteroidia bacterium]|jgi:SSS family transporter|nr:sodium:solute symporter [Bacteroidia bacterium]|tara:strand:- start:12153 stop:13601 length:1449 start_codon:yes stop_codon:yes gene_type:complete